MLRVRQTQYEGSFLMHAHGKRSIGSDEEQSSGKEASADLGDKNGMRKDKGLLGGDKVL